MAKRKVSVYNRCVGREVKDGASFTSAAHKCSKHRTRSGRRHSRSR